VTGMAKLKNEGFEISRYDTHGVDDKNYVSLCKVFLNADFKKQFPQFNYTEREYSQVRSATIEKVKARLEQSAWADFDDFYNCNKVFLIALGEIEFGKLPVLKPLLMHIECFSPKIKGAQYISFAIKRDTFVQYLKELKTKKIDDIKLPYRENPKTNYGRDDKLYRDYRLQLNEGNINTSKTPLIDKFTSWCEVQGININEGVGKAFEVLFEKYPYNKPLEREPDFFDLMPPVSMKDIVQKDGTYATTISMPTMVYAQLRDIFSNYNRSAENGNKEKLTISNFFLMATKFFLDNNKEWTLKYGNPDLYAELKKKAEQARKDIERANGD
jgi:hypothetical protein